MLLVYMKIVNLILFIICICVLIILYEKYKITDIKRIMLNKPPPSIVTKDPQKALIIEKYIFNKNKEFDDKPFIWIHIDYDINARQWLDFGSRNSRNLNRPYVKLCLQQMIKMNGDDFNIVIIDDTSFKDLIPRWETDLVNTPDPLRTHLRTLSLIKLLYHYGGILSPMSFFSIKKLLNTFNTNNAFVFETSQNYGDTKHFHPSIQFIGGKKMNSTIKNIMVFLEGLHRDDYYNLNKFYKLTNTFIQTSIDKNEITILEGSKIGIKTKDNKNININHLVDDSDIKLASDALGLYIPQEELEERTRYNWITYISKDELLNSKTFMGITFNKYLIK
tara:strand:+ start:1712 stop:2713 length:1002 start_codon:yes stop_codon:yes gene_type:complete